MSTRPEVTYREEELSEQAVHDYLAAHPDFFEQHGSLLTNLSLPHVTGGAVSLVERQVSVLRQKDIRLENQLKELIKVARANDLLSAKIHELTLQLFAATDLKSTVMALEEGMRSGFGAEHAVLVVFGNPDAFEDIDAGRFFRVEEKGSAALSPFKTFLRGNAARCGQIRDAQREFLFHEDADEVGSAALIPLSDGKDIGFLAIGSADADRFHPGMSIDFPDPPWRSCLGRAQALLRHRYSPVDDAGWIDRFIRHLELERRLSPQTSKNYRRDLLTLLAYCEQSGIETWQQLDSEHFRAFSAASYRKGLSARSIQRRLSACRTFFRYLIREKHLKKNPITSVSAPKGKKRLPGNLDADRMARLLEIPATARLSIATAPFWSCCTRRACACPNSPISTRRRRHARCDGARYRQGQQGSNHTGR